MQTAASPLPKGTSGGARMVSISEAIAQFVDKNPTQLYRGGA